MSPSPFADDPYSSTRHPGTAACSMRRRLSTVSLKMAVSESEGASWRQRPSRVRLRSVGFEARRDLV